MTDVHKINTKECCHNSFDKMKERNNMDKVTLKFSEAKRVVRKAGIRNIQKYVSLRRTGKLPAGLPSDPKTAYARYWKDWQDFCGTSVESK